jgi:hypothetical protein
LEVNASRFGSPLDPLLTLYNDAGQVVAGSDDVDGSTDARIEITLPRDGAYHLSIADANDQGGPQYLYRLSVRTR